MSSEPKVLYEKTYKDRSKVVKYTGGTDAKTGLSWREAEIVERTRKLRIENEQSERALDKEWIRTERHLQILGLMIEALEHVPGKAKSELGLSDAQSKEIRRMIDEARHSAAEKM